jgi:poly-gamma-glutamate synthesis protein (capsule biosynthesis protein)
MRALGVTHCGLSNIHFFDFGVQGAKVSIAALEAAGIGYTGFGDDEADSRRDLVIEKDGETLCVIAVCEHEYSYALPDRMGARPFDVFDTPLDIRAAKEKYDRVVVMYHGGKEQCTYPSPRLLKACRTMAKSGADLILCQHSHCIGCYEEYNGCHILYGQGNFHFVYPETKNEGWRECLAVYYDTVSDKIEFVPVQQTDTGITLAKGEEKDAILADFAKRNEELANGEWKQGWHAFCEMKRPSYEKAIHFACLEESTERQNHHFAHYLDCEAHTDVWRELFPTYNQTNEK